MRRFFWPVVITILALLFIFGGAIVSLYTDWLWFDNLGFGAIFATRLSTQVEMGLIFGVLFFAIIYTNLWYARKIAPPPSRMSIEQQLIERLGRLARRGIGLVLFGASIVLAAMVGLEAATHWQEWLMYSHASTFGGTDPIFHRDIGFYVFRLPFITYVYHWLFFALFAATVAAIGLHYADEAIEVFGNRLQFAPGVKAHLGLLIAAMFFLKAWGYRLSMYGLLTGQGDLFDGPGYADVHARIPALWILLVIAVIAGIMVLINIARRGIGYAVAAFVVLFGASIVIGAGYPALVQQLRVTPNQLDMERPYISRAIAATQDAYGLGVVKAREFAANTTLTPDQASANTTTIENIRLWDQSHLQRVYNQIQTIQQYYHFQDIDVDRYWLTDPKTGQKRYRQVWLSAREMDHNRLPTNAQTWVNVFLQYTHGYGFAMSPVNEVTLEGMPRFFVSDIPPVSTAGLPLDRMQVYFGELTNSPVFVHTSAPEFDYPTGGRHESTTYDAKAGIRVGGLSRKLLFAARFQDYNIVLNENIRPDSRLLFRRNIADRTDTLFPFLQFDPDPYLVTAGGDLYWIRDGYTSTDQYPYSVHNGIDGSNYIRNSVKVVVNAYTGKVDAYIIDKPFADPIIKTYARMFPGTFKPISKMPAELRDHIRYPERLFSIQAGIYTRYHYARTDADGFYRNNDLWSIPAKANLINLQEQVPEQMEPYYVIMKLPEGTSEEFILMMPYVRSGERKNMVAWMCAKCDGANYGQLVLFNLPEKRNVDGPQQFAARASQDTQISPQLTLWGQSGSTVGSGNLLVIPIESSFLYVMPVYLVSTGAPIPELKRVIVALGDRIAMEPTLNQALAQVLGGAVATAPQMGVQPPSAGPAPPRPSGRPLSADANRLINQAVSQYDKAQAAQRAGDWAEYGRQTEALRATLEELKAKAAP